MLLIFTQRWFCDESVWGDKGGLLPYRMYQVIASPKEELGTWDKIKSLFGKDTEMNDANSQKIRR